MSKQQAAEVSTGFELPQKRIHVRPIKRKGQWLPEGHSGSFLYENTHIQMEVPMDIRTGRKVSVLTKAEREFFEDPSRSGLDFKPGDLSESRRDDNFWDNFPVSLGKTILIIDLSDPMEYLKYAVLRSNTGSHGLIAPNEEAKFNYPTYKYVLVEEGYDSEQDAKRADLNLKAYTFFNTISDSQEKMYDFLMVYWLENARADRPSADAKVDMLKGAINTILTENIKGFLSIIDDPVGYERKVFLHRAIQNGHISYNGKDTYKLMPDDIIIGSNIKEATDYLFSPKNQETMLRIRALMEHKAKIE